MRVSTLQNQEWRTADILAGESRLETAQQQVSSGRRVQRPSDDPAAIAELLRTSSNVAELTRQRDGADSALPFMKATEAALSDITSALRDAQTLALQANTATTSPEQRQVLADQIERIRTRILGDANTQVEGRYLFAGTNTTTQPFTSGPPVTYAGNAQPTQLSVALGAAFDTSVPGTALLNSRSGTDLFQNLSSLENAVRAGNTGGMTAGLAGINQDLDNTARLNGDMGARVNYVDLLRQQTDDNLTAEQGRQSQLQDVDMAKAILDEKTAEIASQATLVMAAKVGQPSLLDYLR